MNKKIKKILEKRNKNWRFPGTVYDNFYYLSHIAKYNKKLLNGKTLGKIISSLVSIEEKPGGPYYSLFPTTKTVKKIVEERTNKMIAEFLSIYNIYLPSLKKYMKSKGTINIENYNKNKCSPNILFTKDEKKIMSGIRINFKKIISSFPNEFQKSAKDIFEKTIRGNKDKQMSLLPYYFWLSLGKPKEIEQKLIEKLGMINILFWSAFIIYDDFWDKDEKADPLLLPIANMFARNHIDYFISVFSEEKSLKTLFDSLMNKQDIANAWEIKNCRIKKEDEILFLPKVSKIYEDYTKKYEPASPHILGPVLILYLLTKDKSSKTYPINEISDLIFFLKNLLIIMQLCDDIYDFEEDLKRGHISTAVDLLLTELNKKTINLTKDIPELKKIFWFVILPKLVDKILFGVKNSRKALRKMTVIKNPIYLEKLISFYENIGEEALLKQKESKEFITAFNY
ncbi:MAG: hypothetical protein WCX79_03535 [Candidatus Paceibacterota bacterium]